MPKNEAIPLFRPGFDITGKAKTAVTGKRFVDVAEPITGQGVGIAPAQPGGLVFGVAAHDAPAGQVVGVIRGPKTVLPMTAAAQIASGSLVEVGADGAAAPHTSGEVVGRALADAAAGADVLIELR